MWHGVSLRASVVVRRGMCRFNSRLVQSSAKRARGAMPHGWQDVEGGEECRSLKCVQEH